MPDLQANRYGIWQTNIVIYDFKKNKPERFDFVRKTIADYWLREKQIELNNYLWDIYPLGWDKNKKDNILLYAYAKSGSGRFFLGTWRLDAQTGALELVSKDKAAGEIELNGYGLKPF